MRKATVNKKSKQIQEPPEKTSGRLDKKEEEATSSNSLETASKIITAASNRALIAASSTPIPYTFRVAAPVVGPNRALTQQQAISPPFYLLLDHTLAVLWCLFRKEGGKDTDLGVGQLQWALYFLKGIKSPNGERRAKDVTIAIQTIENALMELYADMSDVIMPPALPPAVSLLSFSGLRNLPPINCPLHSGQDEPSSCSICEREKSLRLTEAWKSLVPKSSRGKCSSVSLREGRPRKTGESTLTSPIPSFKSVKLFHSPGPEKYFNSVISHVTQFSSSRASMPQSIGFDSSTNLECKSQGSQSDQDEDIKELRTVAEEFSKIPQGQFLTDTKDGTSTANNNLIEEWRKEQVRRVETELRKLRLIENVMGLDPEVTEVAVRKSLLSLEDVKSTSKIKNKKP